MALAPDVPLHAVERAICARVLDGKHGFDALIDAGAIADRFGSVISDTAIGRAAGWAMMRGVRWRLRHYDRIERHHAWTILRRFAWHTSGRGSAAAWLSARRPDRFLLRERCQPLTPALASGTTGASRDSIERHRA